MSGRRNLDRLRDSDRAWNERRWDDYAEFFTADLAVQSGGTLEILTREQHLAACIDFCRAFPNAAAGTDPYLDIFCNSDGTRTCSVARFKGTLRAPWRAHEFAKSRAIGRDFDVVLTVVSRWRAGRIEHQYRCFDVALLLTQLGLGIA